MRVTISEAGNGEFSEMVLSGAVMETELSAVIAAVTYCRSVCPEEPLEDAVARVLAAL